MVVRPYTKGDLMKVRIRLGDDMGAHSEEAMLSGSCFTFFLDGEPVASMGVIHAYHGVGGVWCVISDQVRGHGIEFCRRTRNLLKQSMKIMKIHRAHAFVRKENDEYIRFSRLMGMKIEGVMEKASPEKTDLLMVAKVI